MSPLERFVERSPSSRDERDQEAVLARTEPTGEPGDDRPRVLRRLLGRRPRTGAGTACELCAEPIGDDHRHLVDVRARSLRCACRGCALLFDEEGRASARFRVVPDRHLRLEPFELDAARWTALQVPVGMAFFLHSSPEDRTVAFYPSPGGATESELALDAWDEIVAANPAIADVRPDVEAVLIRVGTGAVGRSARSDAETPACYVVPVDRCYELVGELRLHWHGFDGGQEVRERLDAFFADLDERSTTVGADQ